MVLLSLASSLRDAMRDCHSKDDDEGAIKALCAALLRADVDASTVHGIREGIRRRVQGSTPTEAAQASNGKKTPKTNNNNNNNRKRAYSVRQALEAELASALECEQPHPQWMPTRRRVRGMQRSPPPPAVVMLVGLQGAGKTTSASKLIALYRRRGLRVAAVAADVFRAGAVDQLEQNCARLGGVPVFCDRASGDAAAVLRGALREIEEGEQCRAPPHPNPHPNRTRNPNLALPLT